VRFGRAHTSPLHTRARVRARAAARVSVCVLSIFWRKLLYSCVKMRVRVCVCVRVRVCLARHPCARYIKIYEHGHIGKYGSSAMPCTRMCIGASPMHTKLPVCAGLTARRCPSCVRVRLPLHTATDRHAGWIGIHIRFMHTPCRVRPSLYVRIAEADMRHVRAQARLRARASVCACARPHPRRRV
jgi:hypothetical protein